MSTQVAIFHPVKLLRNVGPLSRYIQKSSPHKHGVIQYSSNICTICLEFIFMTHSIVYRSQIKIIASKKVTTNVEFDVTDDTPIKTLQ